MPRSAKSMAWIFCTSEHILTHLPQSMHFEGSRTMESEELSMGSLEYSIGKRILVTL